MSIRWKIVTSFFIIGMLLSVVLATISYRILEERLVDQLQERLKNLGSLGVRSLDLTAVHKLKKQLGEDLDFGRVRDVESSALYATVVHQLERIRAVEPDLIRYVYVLSPSKNPDIKFFLADADVLTLRQENPEDEAISAFSSTLEIEEYPRITEAVETKSQTVEDELYYDEVYDIYSLSSYTPIVSPVYGYLGLLSIDMSNAQIRDALTEVTRLSVILGGLALLMALLASLAAGWFLTRNILHLNQVMARFTQREFTVRAGIKSHDEVGELGSNFDIMAETIENYSNNLNDMLSSFSRFVPLNMMTILDKEKITDVRLGDQKAIDATLFFSDIRDFTSLSESMTPEQAFGFINDYLRRVGPAVREWRGMVDKYIGDAVMALFPHSPDDAVRASLEVFRRLNAFNDERRAAKQTPIRIGIGLHTGRVMLGIIGEEARVNATVISDNVNLASRIEGLTKLYRIPMLISQDTLEALQDKQLVNVRFVDKVQVKGRLTPVKIWEVIDAESVELQAAKLQYRWDFLEAVQLYYEQRFQEAAEMFTQLRKTATEDQAYRIYFERCQEAMRLGVPAGWDGTATWSIK